MRETIQDGKYVELTYKVTDKKTRHVLTTVEFPLGYVHGHNEILAPSVHMQLEGKAAGETIEVPINGDDIFGPRDESLVFSDAIENVPEEYRQVGTSILMENDRGQTRSFLVTHVDDERLTVDGNNPLSGRQVVFRLEILTVRDATEQSTDGLWATVKWIGKGLRRGQNQTGHGFCASSEEFTARAQDPANVVFSGEVHADTVREEAARGQDKEGASDS